MIAPEEVPISHRRDAGARGAGPPSAAKCSHAERGELRVKESDRISALVRGFRALGVDVEECRDGFISAAVAPRGRRGGRGGRSPAGHGVCGCGARAAAPSRISGADVGRDFLPGILRQLERLARRRCEDGQNLPGRIHGCRQDDGGAARCARSAGAPRTSTCSSRRASGGPSPNLRPPGRAYFRSVEREIIWPLLPLRHAVVATGGGTFVDPENRAAINADGAVGLDRRASRALLAGFRPTAAGRSRTIACRWRGSTTPPARIPAGAVRLDAARAPARGAGRATHRAGRSS